LTWNKKLAIQKLKRNLFSIGKKIILYRKVFLINWE